MLSKETSLFNRNMKISSGIADAKQETHRYITEVDQSGIWVCPDGEGPSSGAAVSTTRGWHIADAIELFRGTARYIKAWLNGTVPTIRIGQDSAGHADVTPSGLEVFTDASTSVASFGSTARIGEVAANTTNMRMTASALQFYINNTVFGSIEEYGDGITVKGTRSYARIGYSGVATSDRGTLEYVGLNAENAAGYSTKIYVSTGGTVQGSSDVVPVLEVWANPPSGTSTRVLSITKSGATTFAGTLDAPTIKHNGTTLGSLATKSGVSLSTSYNQNHAQATLASNSGGDVTVVVTISAGWEYVAPLDIYTTEKQTCLVGSYTSSYDADTRKVTFTVTVRNFSSNQKTFDVYVLARTMKVTVS